MIIKRLIFLFATILLVFSTLKVVNNYAIKWDGAARVEIVIDKKFEDRVFDLVNEERIKAGISPLARNSLLDKSAELKLQDMLDRQYWDHITPDGKPPWIFIEATGYKYHFAGENLATDFISPEGFVSGWMNSLTHKQNILSTNFTESGVAVSFGKMGGVDRIFAVQHFGSPE